MPFRTGHRQRTPSLLSPRLRAACVRVAALGAALWAAWGCGLKAPPRPLSEVLPPTAGLRAWQREASVMVSWQLPDAGRQQRYGGLRGFVLTVQSQPLLCLECPAGSPQEVQIPADAPALQRQGASLFYALPLAADAGRIAVSLRTRFGLGLGPQAGPVVVERAGAIPLPDLAWRWSGSGEGSGARSVQFYWETRQERLVQVIGEDGQPRERAQSYRANLYRRVLPGLWPPEPLNGQPLQAASWIVPPLQAEFPPNATAEAYVLRYVDQFGNEGPASPEVLIPLSGRRP